MEEVVGSLDTSFYELPVLTLTLTLCSSMEVVSTEAFTEAYIYFHLLLYSGRFPELPLQNQIPECIRLCMSVNGLSL